MDTAFRVEFETIEREEMSRFASPYLDKKDWEEDLRNMKKPFIDRKLERWFGLDKKEPIYNPALVIKLYISNEARALIEKLGLLDDPVVPDLPDYYGFTFGHAIRANEKGHQVKVYRKRIHDIHILQEEIVKKLQHYKSVLESHSAPGTSSHEI